MDVFTGMIASFGFSFAPVHWSTCSGQLLAIAQFQALYSLLGTSYGGDARSVFGLPDLRGRTPIGQGQGPGLTDRIMGQAMGTETVTMTAANLPPHTHTATFSPSGGGTAFQILASQNPGNKTVPAAGDYLAKTVAGLDDAKSYTDTPGTTVPLGGVSGGGGSGVVTVDNTGGGLAMPNMQPYLVINWCIAVQGLYPQRN
jgi:microcystin-dependent protein